MEGTPRWSRWIPKGDCEPVGGLCWKRLLPGPAEPWREEPVLKQAGLVTLWGPKLEQRVPEGWHPVEGNFAGAVHEELQLVGRTHAGEVCGELSPVTGTSECEESSP